MNTETGYPYSLEVKQKPAESFAVLTPFEFLADFRLEAQRAKHRVWGQAMSMQVGHPGGPLFHAFRDSAKRELDTKMNIDYFSRMVSQTGINWIGNLKSIGKKDRTYHRFNQQVNMDMYRSLEESGVQVTFTNPPIFEEKILPFFGRNHIKMFIVDDVAWIGGVNIDDVSFKGVDFMVKVTDPEVIEALANQFTRVRKGNSHRYPKDYRVDFSDGSSLIVDGGEPRKSLIRDTAVELVDNAQKSVKNISFITPDGKFLGALHSAYQRGVDVQVLTPTVVGGIYKFFDLFNKHIFMPITKQNIPLDRYDGALHAKLLIVDGTVVIGSHNNTVLGVWAGTEELAYISSNPKLIRNLINFYDKARAAVK